MSAAECFAESVKVLLAYGALVYLWPAIIFRKWLRNKERTVYFSFCILISSTLIPNIILLLGLTPLLNATAVRILFWGSLGVSLLRSVPPLSKFTDVAVRVRDGSLPFRQVGLDILEMITRKLRNAASSVAGFFRGHLVEYGLLVAVMAFGIAWTANGIYQNSVYGFGDMYVHHSWVGGLLNGNSFSGGIYPEGMHTHLYLFHILFGLDVYNANLFYFIPRNISLFISIAIMIKEFFPWKFSGSISIGLYMMLKITTSDHLRLSRFAWNLPMEAGMIGSVLTAVFLHRFLTSETANKKRRLRDFLKDDNLLLIFLGVATTLIMHFYATIYVVLLCAGVGLVHFRKLFRKYTLKHLILILGMSFILSVLPFGVALAEGKPLEQSLYWAMSVMKGDKEEEKDTKEAATGPAEAETEKETEPETTTQIETAPKKGVIERFSDVYLFKTRRIYTKPFVMMTMFGWISSSVIAVGGSLYCHFLKKKKGRESRYKDMFTGHLIMSVIMFIEITIANADVLGLPVLISFSRMVLLTHLLFCTQMVAPLDYFFTVWQDKKDGKLLKAASVAVMCALYVMILKTDSLHDYLYAEVIQHQKVIDVIHSIEENYPKKSYTIVTTTSEIYLASQSGYHEEITRFVGMQEGKMKLINNAYRLPSEYIFLIIEKKSLKPAHATYFAGPSWLVNRESSQKYNIEVQTLPITEEAAKTDISNINLKKWDDTYNNTESRNILESKMYYWAQDYMKLYPNEMSLYYEDENIVSYVIHQNPQNPLNLLLE